MKWLFPVLGLMALALLASCKIEVIAAPTPTPSDSTPQDEVTTYFAEARVLGPASEAYSEWTKASDSFILQPPIANSTDDFLRMRMLLELTDTAIDAHRETLESFRQITPPEQCRTLYLHTLQAFTLQQQAILEFKNFLYLGQSPTSKTILTNIDNKDLKAGSALIYESDSEKKKASLALDSCIRGTSLERPN